MAMTDKTKRLLGFGLIIDCVILDQLSKWLILEHVFKPKINEPSLGLFEWLSSPFRLPLIQDEILPFFNLTMVWNQGISFGMFQNGNPWPLIIVAALIAIVFSVWLTKATKWMEVIALSMVIGGALGNIIDRLHFKAVADFLDFHVMGWHFPAFNLADSFISVGIITLIIFNLFFAEDSKRNKEQA